MKKFFKWIFIIAAVLVVLLLAAAIALPFILPMDKIKDMAAQKMSEAIHRDVKIGKVSFNIFTGIGIDNLYISNRKGYADKPFVTASKIELKYDLWSLFSGRFKINKVALIKPEILIEKKGQEYNFSDMIPAAGSPAPKEQKKEEAKGGGAPVVVDISSVIIKNATFSYLEYTKAGVNKNGFSGLNLALSGMTMDLSKPISLNSSATVIYQGKPVPVSLSFLANVNLQKEKAKVSNFKLGAAGDTLSADVSVNGFTKDQDIKFDVSSNRINLDNFAAILSGKAAPVQQEAPPSKPSPHGALTKAINDMAKQIPAGMKVNGNISLNNITFKEMALDSFNVNINMADKQLKMTSRDTAAYKGKLNTDLAVNFVRPGLAYTAQKFTLSNFDAATFANAVVGSFFNTKDFQGLKDKVFGTLDFNADIAGAGVENPELMKNVSGTISFNLKDGMIKRVQALANVGEKIGLSFLKKDMAIKTLNCNATISNGILNIKSLHMDNGKASDMIVDFKGPVDFVNQYYGTGNTLTIRLSPRVTPAALSGFKDSTGWAVLDFSLVGPLSMPIPVPLFTRSIGALGEKAKEQINKGINTAVSNEVTKQGQQLKDQLEKGIKNLFNVK